MKPWDIEVSDDATVFLKGKTFKEIMAELRAARNISVTAPLVSISNDSGTAISLRQQDETDFVETTGSDLGGGVYAGTWWRWTGTAWQNMGACRVRKV